MKYPYYCFVEFLELEQLEPGDTLHHRFHMPGFAPGQERWYYFYGYQAGELADSVSPVFHVKYDEESEMITLGIYSEAETLEGEVKLEQGDGVTLTRSDGHNSIIITAVAGIPDGFGFPWFTTWSPDPAVGYTHWDYDELTISISQEGHKVSVATAKMELYDFVAPHSIEFAAKRTGLAGYLLFAYAALTDSSIWLWDFPNSRHIGFMHANNRLYASNADGVARTLTEIALPGLAGRQWLKWVRFPTYIIFYINGVQVALHTTNLPGQTSNCRFIFQVISTYDNPGEIHFTHPRYAP